MGLGSALFGKPGESKSKSANTAFMPIMQAFSPAFGYTASGGDALASLLGLPGGGRGPGGSAGYSIDMRNDGISGNAKRAQRAGEPTTYTIGGTGEGEAGTPFDPASQEEALANWANSGGMQFLMDQGRKAVEGSAAGRGMLQSGDTLKGLTKFGQGLGSTYLQQYMDNLFKFANLGLGAGGLAAGAGSWSKGSSTTPKQGMAGQLAQAGATAYAGR